MNITVIGCGNAGSAIAADLSLKGHEVTMFKSSSALHNDHFEKVKGSKTITLIENGIEKKASVNIATSIEDSIKGKDLIIIFIQTSYHEDLIKKISSYLEDGQTILMEPGYLSTCYFLTYCQKKITIVEAESSPIDCRIIAPGKVKVFFRNVRNPVGIFPKENTPETVEMLNQLDLSFTYLDSVIEAALHNPNLIVHTVGAVMSVPRIEYVKRTGDKYSMYKEVFMPHIWNMVETLDQEKMQILEKVGSKKTPYVEACKFRNSLDDDRDAVDVFFDYANNSAPDGPYEPDSRYITEDVSQGLVMLESLGNVLKIKTPVCSSLIDIASAMLKTDFRSAGRTLDKLNYLNIKRIICDAGYDVTQ